MVVGLNERADQMVLFVGTEQSKGYRYLNHLLFTGLELRLCQERTTGYSPVYKIFLSCSRRTGSRTDAAKTWDYYPLPRCVFLFFTLPCTIFRPSFVGSVYLEGFRLRNGGLC